MKVSPRCWRVGSLGLRVSALSLGSIFLFAAHGCTLSRVKDSLDGGVPPEGGIGSDGATDATIASDTAATDGSAGATDATIANDAAATDGSAGASTDFGTDASALDGNVADQDSGNASADADDPKRDNEFCPPEAGPSPSPPPSVINFDVWPDGRPIPGETHVTSQFPGVVFSSNDCSGPETYSDGEATSPPNFLVGYPLRENVGVSPIAMDFFTPASKVGVTLISVGDSTVTATAYDKTLSTVATISVTHPGTGAGAGARDPIMLSGDAGIVRVTVVTTKRWPPPNGLGDGFGIDDVLWFGQGD
jgi:hypothetical protein